MSKFIIEALHGISLYPQGQFTMTPSVPSAISLFDVPREIRDNIYKFTVLNEEDPSYPVNTRVGSRNSRYVFRPLLHIQQTREEYLEAVLNHAFLSCRLGAHPDHKILLLTHIPSSHAHKIKKLNVSINFDDAVYRRGWKWDDMLAQLAMTLETFPALTEADILIQSCFGWHGEGFHESDLTGAWTASKLRQRDAIKRVKFSFGAIEWSYTREYLREGTEFREKSSEQFYDYFG